MQIVLSLCLLAALAAAIGFARAATGARRDAEELRRREAQARSALALRARAAADLGHALETEIAAVRNETSRLRALVGDAIGDLAASLEDLSRQTHVQDAVVTRLLRRDESGAGASHNVRRVSRMSAGIIRTMTDALAQATREREHATRLAATLGQQLDAFAAHQAEFAAMEDDSKALARNVAEESMAGERGRGRLDVAAIGLRRLAQRAAGLGEQLRTLLPVARETAERVGAAARPIAGEALALHSARDQAGRMLEEIASAHGTIDTGIREVEAAGYRINAAIGNAVRCLQIDDIASQSLALMDRHLDRIVAIADETTALVSARRARGTVDWRTPADKPLSRATMLEGSVELF